MSTELATVSFRTESGITEDEPWTAVSSAVLSNAVPWRTFRWYNGQQHYSGTYWCATMHGHVVYESRLEPRHANLTGNPRPARSGPGCCRDLGTTLRLANYFEVAESYSSSRGDDGPLASAVGLSFDWH